MMMRRRPATHSHADGSDDFVVVQDGYPDEDGGPSKQRRKQQLQVGVFARWKRYPAWSLLASASMLLLWTRLLPVTRQSFSFRSAAVRLLISTTTASADDTVTIIFASPLISAADSNAALDRLGASRSKIGGRPNYNGLLITPLPDRAIARAIHADKDNLRFQDERFRMLDALDDDVDGQRQRVQKFEDYAPLNRECRRNNWRDRVFPNCLVFHETSVLDRAPALSTMDDEGYLEIQYSGHGYFRDSWIYRQAGDDDGFVLKKMRLIDALDYNEEYSK
jgi:hypothetical protein